MSRIDMGDETGSVSVNVSWHQEALFVTVHVSGARRHESQLLHDPSALDSLAADLQELAAEIRRRRAER